MTSLLPQTNQVTYGKQTGYADVPPANDNVKKYADVFKKLGIVQLVLGVLSMVFGIAVLAYANENGSYSFNPYSYRNSIIYRDIIAQFGTGIWAGIFFLISGILGVLTGKKKTRCLNVAALVMTIFSAIFAVILLGFEIPGAIASCFFRGKWMVSCGIHSTLCVIAFTEFVVSIVHSAYCCGAHCCHKPAQQATQYTTYAYANPAPQIPATQLPNQPGTYIQAGPFMQPQSGQVVVTSTAPQPANTLQIQQLAPFPQSQVMQQPPTFPTE